MRGGGVPGASAVLASLYAAHESLPTQLATTSAVSALERWNSRPGLQPQSTAQAGSGKERRHNGRWKMLRVAFSPKRPRRCSSITQDSAAHARCFALPLFDAARLFGGPHPCRRGDHLRFFRQLRLVLACEAIAQPSQRRSSWLRAHTLSGQADVNAKACCGDAPSLHKSDRP